MNKNYSFWIFFAFVVYLVFTLYHAFLLDIAIAALLAIASIDLHKYFFKKTKNRLWATSYATLIVAFLLLGPIIYFVVIISDTIANIRPELIKGIIAYLSDNLPNFALGYEDKIKETLRSLDIQSISKNVITIFGGIGAKSAIFIKDSILILIFFFFAHYYGKKILLFLQKNLPINSKNAKILFDEISVVMSITTYSILTTAIFEGFLFALPLYFLGYDAILFGILYGFASLIPVVGGILMWLPVSAYEFYHGNVTHAVFIALYSIIVISIVADTIIKPLIINFINKKIIEKKAKINSLVIFFAIVAGISAYGFWGMILGPAITALFVAMIMASGDLKS